TVTSLPCLMLANSSSNTWVSTKSPTSPACMAPRFRITKSATVALHLEENDGRSDLQRDRPACHEPVHGAVYLLKGNGFCFLTHRLGAEAVSGHGVAQQLGSRLGHVTPRSWPAACRVRRAGRRRPACIGRRPTP